MHDMIPSQMLCPWIVAEANGHYNNELTTSTQGFWSYRKMRSFNQRSNPASAGKVGQLATLWVSGRMRKRTTLSGTNFTTVTHWGWKIAQGNTPRAQLECTRALLFARMLVIVRRVQGCAEVTSRLARLSMTCLGGHRRLINGLKKPGRREEQAVGAPARVVCSVSFRTDVGCMLPMPDGRDASMRLQDYEGRLGH